MNGLPYIIFNYIILDYFFDRCDCFDGIYYNCFIRFFNQCRLIFCSNKIFLTLIFIIS